MKNLIILILAAGLLISWRINNREKNLSIYFPNSLVHINTTKLKVEFENLDTILSFQTWDELDNYIGHLSVKEMALNEIIPEYLNIYDHVLVHDSIPVYQNTSYWVDPKCREYIQVGIIVTKKGYLDYEFISYE